MTDLDIIIDLLQLDDNEAEELRGNTLEITFATDGEIKMWGIH